MEISDNIELDIELLRSTPAKKFIDKRIKPYLNEDKFEIPANISKSKTKLYSLTDNLLKIFAGKFIFRHALRKKSRDENFYSRGEKNFDV